MRCSLILKKSADFLVKVGTGGFFIRDHPKHTDTKAQTADNNPSEETEIKQEEPCFVSVHNATAFVNTLLPCKVRIVVFDIIDHRVTVSLYDAGNHKEKRPKESIN